MEENDGPPVESMEVEESFPPMEAVEDKMVSSSSSSSPNSEEEVSKGCFCHDIMALWNSPSPFAITQVFLSVL